jgi:putative ABC transport system permease protein
MHEVEPARSIYEVMPLEQHLYDALAENRLRTELLSFFALTAVSLACIGLYGTLSYVVSIRRREVGLRLAMGAARRQITEQFLREALRVSLIGCTAGLVLAALFTRVLNGMLYGVNSLDAVTFAGVGVLMLLTAALSAWMPAMRAARLEPVQVLREE